MRAFYFTRNPVGHVYAGKLREMTERQVNLLVQGLMCTSDASDTTCVNNQEHKGANTYTGAAHPKDVWFVKDDLREMQLETYKDGGEVTYIYPFYRSKIVRPISVETL